LAGRVRRWGGHVPAPASYSPRSRACRKRERPVFRGARSGFRFYNPSTGRWISRDPLGELGGSNLSAFAPNDPVSAVDVLGLKKLSLRYRTIDLCSLNDGVNSGFATRVYGLAGILRDIKWKIGDNYDPNGWCGNCIARLVITAHSGQEGLASFSPKDSDVFRDNIYGSSFSSEEAAAIWAEISSYFFKDGEVYLQQCEAGGGELGTDMLKCLSKKAGVPVCAPSAAVMIGRSPRCYKIAYPDGSLFQ
jgi:RHS repeat-associated protein